MIITSELLKKYSIIPFNYNMDEVMLYVNLAEQLWVQPLIGQSMYEEINAQVATNTVSPENATLLVNGGLYQYLSCAVLLQFLPNAYLKISEVGITKTHSDNSESATLEDITYLQSHLRSELETRKRALINWIEEHIASYPKFEPEEQFCGCKAKKDTCGCTVGLVNPQPMQLVYTTPKRNKEIR